jgi:hypothetical protein
MASIVQKTGLPLGFTVAEKSGFLDTLRSALGYRESAIMPDRMLLHHRYLGHPLEAADAWDRSPLSLAGDRSHVPARRERGRVRPLGP